MDTRRKYIKQLTKIRVCLISYWAMFLVAGSVTIVLIVTLLPFSFDTSAYISLAMISEKFFDQKLSIEDLIANVLLFFPLGFGLAGVMQDRPFTKQQTLFVSLIFSGSLSLSVEALQILLPMRSPSILDLFSNSIGGVIGTAGFYIWDASASRFSLRKLLESRCLTQRKLTFSVLCYAGLVLYLIVALQRTYNFSTWDPTFPLLIGNERTGDRPWNGMISQVYISNRALSFAEISQIFSKEESRDSINIWTTAYQLIGNRSYPDLKGISPDLRWQGRPPEDEEQKMISITKQNWLLTQAPVTKLNQDIINSSQFGLLTTISTNDYQQAGPARIISFSVDPFHYNLTIGQQGNRLIVRLRTSESNLEFAFPGIFINANPHRLLFSFDHATLHLFVDRVEQIYTLKLSPEIFIFRFFPAIGIRNFQVTPINQRFLKGAFYSILLLPVIALTGLIIRKHVHVKIDSS